MWTLCVNKKTKQEAVFLSMFMLHHQMFRVKKFLSLTALVIGGLIGASTLTYFTFAQNYETLWDRLFDRVLQFIMPKHDIWLYAETEPNRYTVSFDGNWWMWSMSGMDMIYDVEVNLLANNFTRNWYIFGWWSTSKTWMIEYSNQQLVKNLTAENSGEVVLYAQRTGSQVPYTIEYYVENVDGTWYDLVETGAEYGVVGPQVVMTGKTYTWFTLQTGAEVNITSGWVVPYYYTRNTYNLIVKDREDTLINTWIKYEANILPILPAELTWWTWNTFSWWDNIPEWGIMPAEDVVITSVWTYGVHSIIFDTDGWTEIEPITGNYGDIINAPENPTRTGYEFVWWEPEFPITMSWDDVTVKAIWKEVSEDKWWWSGWWWWRSGWGSSGSGDSWDDSTGEGEHGSAIDSIDGERPTTEVLIAYMWARNKWIIDTSRKDSDPDGYIPRWDMAEMVVKFTEKVLGREIPSEIPSKCCWWDASREWKSLQTKIYAEKACALWVMWIRMQNFMPNKILDRAEFGTILSRLLWWDKYDVVDATKTKLYYTKHLNALNKEWIMKQIENPENRKELRKWAWLMLMRVKF